MTRTKIGLWAVAMAVVSMAPLLLVTATPSAATGAPGSSVPASYYLALGDSVPVWDRTHSYAHLLENHYASSVTKLTLVNMAVSEATTTSMLNTGQYQSALQFLHKHVGHVALITIDIGGNDIVHCATPTGLDMTCIAAGMDTVHTNLTTMLAGLAGAAPGVRIIGMNYYDPYLGDWLAGGALRQVALGSVSVVASLNTALTSLYGGSAVTADVQDAYKTTNDTSMVRSPWGRAPVDVKLACSWLWITCREGRKEGFADDPNIAGQKIIAAAFERTIGKLSAP
jgi:lysophospholipase L1-like esterase